MNISITINIDDEQLTPNEELNTTLSEIVTSYIRQTLGGKKVSNKSRKGGSGHGPRPSWSEEDKNYLMTQSKLLLEQGMKPSQVWRSIAEHINKSADSVYQYYTAQKKKESNGK